MRGFTESVLTGACFHSQEIIYVREYNAAKDFGGTRCERKVGGKLRKENSARKGSDRVVQ